MNVLGQLSLFVAFITSGYAAFVCAAGGQHRHRAIGRSGLAAGLLSIVAVTVVSLVLIHALLVRDFRFQYVAHYSNALLPWYYSLSAFWVGQAGSLLFWAWSLAVVALAYRFWPVREVSPLREPVFGLLMAYLCFLVAIMVFAADPMETSLMAPQHGSGLTPLLQHPAMLIHPPIVFLGYALWAVPFALAIVALASRRLDTHWIRAARPWALLAWIVLGIGILLGGLWAYEELGWGGYWGWDPVENGSLMPWLSGTALIHGLLGWQYRGVFKKTVVALTIVTFGLCNFATFLTRSGVFSSVHAFSESPIGWLFLLLMLVLAIGGIVLLVRRRSELRGERPLSTLMSRESVILISILALLLLVLVTLAGTISVPLSDLLLGRKITFGPAYYNNVLIPVAFFDRAQGVTRGSHYGECSARRGLVLRGAPHVWIGGRVVDGHRGASSGQFAGSRCSAIRFAKTLATPVSSLLWRAAEICRFSDPPGFRQPDCRSDRFIFGHAPAAVRPPRGRNRSMGRAIDSLRWPNRARHA
jgi:cytochrome c-type biogenesis protein CcmF